MTTLFTMPDLTQLTESLAQPPSQDAEAEQETESSDSVARALEPWVEPISRDIGERKALEEKEKQLLVHQMRREAENALHAMKCELRVYETRLVADEQTVRILQHEVKNATLGVRELLDEAIESLQHSHSFGEAACTGTLQKLLHEARNAVTDLLRTAMSEVAVRQLVYGQYAVHPTQVEIVDTVRKLSGTLVDFRVGGVLAARGELEWEKDFKTSKNVTKTSKRKTED